VNAQQLNVFRDGTPADWLLGNNLLLADGFDNGDPFVGTAYRSTGNPAQYTLYGAASPEVINLAVSEPSGQLRLDPNHGAVANNAAGQPGTSLRLRLLTNITDTNAGLHVSRSFAATVALSLSAAPDPSQTFGLRLTDGGIDPSNNDVIELYWAGGAGGGNVVLRKQDFAAGTVTSLGSAPMAAPAGATMLVLALSHDTPGSSLISGSFGYADSTGSLLGSVTTFGNRATACTVTRDQLTGPKFYEHMSKLLDDLIAQSRSDAEAYEEFLRKAEDLVRKLAAKQPGTDVPAPLHGNAQATAIYNNLDSLAATTFKYPTAEEDRAALALKIDLVVRERAPAGWKGDETRKRTVQNAIYPLLDSDREATQALFDIIKNRPGH
jgi:hypothetical protein